MKALIDRNAEQVAGEMLATFPGLVIEGARQVGKSTLAAQLAKGRGAVIANLDHEATRAAAIADPEAFVRQGGRGLLVIDEIQRRPELTLAVKAAIDADRRPGRFLLTGSASLLRVRGISDSLAGRVARLPLFGLSQGERKSTTDDLIHALLVSPKSATQQRSELSRSDYVRIVGDGGYPELVAASNRMRRQWIDAYLAGIIRRDLPELRRSVSPSRTLGVLRALAGNQSGELVRARLAQDTDVPASTISGYLDLLHDVGLVASLPPWTPNLAKREVGRHKAFVLDSALAMYLARVTAEQLNRLEYGEAPGKMLEGFVVAELLKQQSWSAESYELFHYRERSGAEVDVVVEFDDGRVLALEVKSSTSFNASQFKGLKTLRDALGERFLGGYVLNTGQAGYTFAPRLHGLPIASLWEMQASR